MIRLITSGLIVFGVLAAVAGLSSALFQSNPVSMTPNTFATGSASLQIALDNQGTPGEYTTLIGGADIDNLVPGGFGAPFYFWLKNTSTDPIELTLDADLTNISTEGDLGEQLRVQFTCDVADAVGDDGSTPSKSLNTWDTLTPAGTEAIGTATLGPVNDLDSSDEARCRMDSTLGVDSTASNMDASFNALFTGEQALPSS